MITLIDQIKSFQAHYRPEQAQFWAYQSVLDLITNITEEAEKDAYRKAIDLVERFTSYGIQCEPEVRNQYARFAALQHINIITSPDMKIEDVIFNLTVASKISRK